MPKLVNSPVAHFPGTVTLSDPMRIDQAQAVEKAIRAVKALEKDDPGQSDIDALIIPAVMACVEKMELEGVGDFIPASPRAASAELINWLFVQVLRVYSGSGDVPDPNA